MVNKGAEKMERRGERSKLEEGRGWRRRGEKGGKRMREKRGGAALKGYLTRS